MSKGEKKRRRALDAYWALQRAATLAAERVDDAVHPFGLSASQYGVLDTLQHRGPTHQQELAETLGRSKAQMTAIIDALEARALVRRERHAVDRRFISVYLTEAGYVLLADAGPARTEAVVSIMRELSGDQKTRLTRLCRRLLRVLDPAGDPGLLDPDDADDQRDLEVAEITSGASDASDTPPIAVPSEADGRDG